MEQEREEALSKQAVLQVQKYEGEKVKESNVDEIIQKALRKKRDNGDNGKMLSYGSEECG